MIGSRSISSLRHRACLAVFVIVAGEACAAAERAGTPDSRDVRVEAQSLNYGSPFADYRPFQEPQVGSWKEANKEAANNSAMGHNMGAMTTPGKDKSGGPGSGDASAGHDMGAMKSTATKAAPGMPAQAKSPNESRGHDMGAMKGAQGKERPNHDMAAMRGARGSETIAMAAPHAEISPASGRMGAMSGTGVVQSIDKGGGKIRLTHDPIAALAWPKMTLTFRLKDGRLAEHIKQGDSVDFSLEKSSSGFVISALRKGSPGDSAGFK